ncbi:MAG: hypothetical protein EBZ13_14900 [Planctomycetia bacterium]|nr:hypothetical protein [Planctomycetia bacterium]
MAMAMASCPNANASVWLPLLNTQERSRRQQVAAVSFRAFLMFAPPTTGGRCSFVSLRLDA